MPVVVFVVAVDLIAAGATIAAAASNDTSNPLVAYGLLGIILATFTWLVLTERLVPGSLLEKAEKRADAMEAKVIDQVLPTATEMVHATREVLDYLRSRQT